MNKLITEYAALKLQEIEIKERMSQIQDQVTDLVQEQGGMIELPYGDSISIRVNKNWSYPKYLANKVKALKQKAKLMEDQWKLKNSDKFEPKPSLVYNKPK